MALWKRSYSLNSASASNIEKPASCCEACKMDSPCLIHPDTFFASASNLRCLIEKSYFTFRLVWIFFTTVYSEMDCLMIWATCFRLSTLASFKVIITSTPDVCKISSSCLPSSISALKRSDRSLYSSSNRITRFFALLTSEDNSFFCQELFHLLTSR